MFGSPWLKDLTLACFIVFGFLVPWINHFIEINRLRHWLKRLEDKIDGLYIEEPEE